MPTNTKSFKYYNFVLNSTIVSFLLTKKSVLEL